MYSRQNVMSRLRLEEDDRRYPYDDNTGKPPVLTMKGNRVGKLTAGVGRNLTDKPLSDATVNLWLMEDLDEAERTLDALLPGWRSYVDDLRQEVLVDMAFNMGQSRLSGFKNMLAAIRNRDWPHAATEGRDSAWFSQVGNRAVNLMNILEHGA